MLSENQKALRELKGKLMDVVIHDPLCDQHGDCKGCPYNNGYDHEEGCWKDCDLELLNDLINHISRKDGTLECK